MRTYLKLGLTALLIFVAIGVAGPLLISAQSDEAVIAGFALVAAGLPLSIHWIWRRDINAITHPFKENH